MTTTLTIREILSGTALGPAQSAGLMQVIPLLGQDDATFAPPRVQVGTRAYGTVELRNHANRPTLVPHGTGWVVQRKAQDHALAGGVLVAASEQKVVDTAMCIQQSQGGTIAVEQHQMVMLPAALRAKALATRNQQGFSRLWQDIEAFNQSFGISTRGGHVEYFLRHFAQELDAFVAQFEAIPAQLGAIVLVAGAIVGVERAPSSEYWKLVWAPLVRGCYGSLALAASRAGSTSPTRAPLRIDEPSIAGVRKALRVAEAEEQTRLTERSSTLAATPLETADASDAQLGDVELRTVAGADLCGQVATLRGEVRFASLCAQ